MANTTGESEIGSDPLPPRLREPLLAQRELDTRRAKDGGHVDAELDAALGQMGRALVCMGLDQSTGIRVLVAWLVFLIIGIGMPAVNLWATSCKECRNIQNTKYEVMVQISQIAVAAISLVCISRNLRKYGLEKFLLLDQYPDRLPRFCHAYVAQLCVCTVVQLVAVLLCLRGAAKVSHRAQSIASIASKWHALATCNTCDMPDAKDESNEEHTTRDEDPIYSPFMDDYESDLESSADLTLPSDSQLASVVISYHKRQALVMYFQLNHGGITIFGFNVDRVQINTIFFIEFSLVLWILGKTIVAT